MKNGRSPLVGDVCERANVPQPRALPFSQCHGPVKLAVFGPIL